MASDCTEDLVALNELSPGGHDGETRGKGFVALGERSFVQFSEEPVLEELVESRYFLMALAVLRHRQPSIR